MNKSVMKIISNSTSNNSIYIVIYVEASIKHVAFKIIKIWQKIHKDQSIIK